MPVTLALRPEGVRKIARLARIESDRAFAERIGIDPGQFSRVLTGKSAPGPQFIAGAIEAFGRDCFDDLFRVVEKAA